jgi:hypothetical protein
MGKRRRSKDEEPEPEQPQTRPADEEGRDTPEFRQSVILGLVFVTLPALVMLALKEQVWAAAWFGVGVTVIAVGSWRQIQELWRSLRSGSRRGGG